MALKNIEIKVTKGMNQDNSAQVFDPQAAFYLLNLKNQVINRGGLQALTNEKGTKEITLYIRQYSSNGSYTQEKYKKMNGNIVGVAQCTSTMGVLFVRQESDCMIYRIKYVQDTDTIEGVLIANDAGTTANNKFNFGDYISSIFCYENSEIQKVYWVDGKNELRYINISDSAIQNGTILTERNQLSANPSFTLGHTLKVEVLHGGGIFQPGIIQYCFTYYKQYGPETGIVDISPMYYIAEDTRGVAADQTVGMSFKVSIINPDKEFDYARVYSIQRTSLNGTPIVKIVKDIKLN